MGGILVVCTGNICRSPMAEAFLRGLLLERGAAAVPVRSAGVHGWDGSGATPEAVLALGERGLDISPHTARRLTADAAEDADLVIAMAAEHRDAIGRLVPEAAGRTFTLKELVRLLESEGRREDRPAAGGDPWERLRAAVAAADEVRSKAEVGTAPEEDVADPLGLGIEAFRAAAWEVGEYAMRLANLVFGPASPPVERRRHGGVELREDRGP